MSDRLAMAREGSQFTSNGISLSWPHGGVRQVIDLPAAQRPSPWVLRIANRQIVETDLPVTDAPVVDVPENRLLTGEEARRHKAIPAGPVIPMADHERFGAEAHAFYEEQGALAEDQRTAADAEAEAKAAAIETEAKAKADAEAEATAKTEAEAKPADDADADDDDAAPTARRRPRTPKA